MKLLLFIAFAAIAATARGDFFWSGTAGGTASDWIGSVSLQDTCGRTDTLSMSSMVTSTQTVSFSSNSWLMMDILVGSCGTTSTSVPTLSFFVVSSSSTQKLGCNPAEDASCTTDVSSPQFGFVPGKWGRVVVPIPSTASSGQLRLYSSSSIHVDNIRVTSACPSGCNLNGQCTSTGCVCDSGFTKSQGTCVPNETPATTLTEEFEDDISWLVRGGQPALSPCANTSPGRSLVFAGSTQPRIALTPMLSTVNASSIGFWIQPSDGASCPGSLSSSQRIVVGYSTNGGVTYNVLGVYSYANRWLISLPEEAKANFVQFVFTQHTFSSGSDAWAIDGVHLASSLKPSSVSYANFSESVDTDNGFLYSVGAKLGQMCRRDALFFSNTVGTSMMVMRDIETTASTVLLQMDVSTGCSGSVNSFNVQLQYMDPQHFVGNSWQRVVTSSCTSSSTSSCTTWTAMPSNLAQSYEWAQGFRRISLKVAYRPGRVFRLVTATSSVNTWGLAALYLGEDCNCGSNGICYQDTCICDEGFELNSDGWCIREGGNPTLLRDTFGDDVSPMLWHTLTNGNNAVNGGNCRSSSSQTSIFFNGRGSRYLQSQEFDLRGQVKPAIAYNIQLGSTSSSSSCPSPSSSSDYVVFGYSTDGRTWKALSSHEYYCCKSGIREFVSLPSSAITEHTSFMWMQPFADGTDDVFNIYDVATQQLQPGNLLESFQGYSKNNTNLVLPQSLTVGTGCGRTPVATLSSSATEALFRPVVMRKDLHQLINDQESANPFTWANITGGAVSTVCGASEQGFLMNFGLSSRQIVSGVLDLSAPFISINFRLSIGTGTCNAIEAGEGIVFEISKDGGSNWDIIETFSSNTVYDRAYASGSIGATKTTILRWRQLSFDVDNDVWSVSRVSVQGREPSKSPMLTIDFALGCNGGSSHAMRLSTAASSSTSFSSICSDCNPLSSSSCQRLSQHGCRWDSSTFIPGKWYRTFVELDEIDSLQLLLWAGSSSTDFHVSRVFMGVDCTCGGHGICDGQLNCICDTGYAVDADGKCVPSAPLPTSYYQPFDDLQPEDYIVTSAIVSNSLCRKSSTNYMAIMNSENRRLFVTSDLDTRNASFVDFIMLLGYQTSTTGCVSSPSSSSEGISLSYSTDGGISYTPFKLIAIYSGTMTLQQVALPEEAKRPATRFMWLQSSASTSVGYDTWGLDDIVIGPSIAPPSSLFGNFSQPINNALFIANNGQTKQFCDREALVFSRLESSDITALTTVPTDLPSKSFIQLMLSSSCYETSNSYTLTVQYSDNQGESWNNVMNTVCNPVSSSTCTSWIGTLDEQLRFTMLSGGYHRISIPLYSTRPGRRFRVVDSGSSWAISQLYIGNGCGGSDSICGGHGTCNDGVCACDSKFIWDGATCAPRSQLPSKFVERFEGALSETFWTRALGYGVSSTCAGPISENLGKVFNKGTVRLIETADLNTTDATLLEFRVYFFGTSSCSSPSSSSEGVVIAYSTNGGLSWTKAEVLPYYSYRTPTYVSVVLTEGMKTQATRFLFWQPAHSTSTNYDVWGIDDVMLVSVPPSLPNHIQESFGNTSSVISQFALFPNGQLKTFCYQDAMVFSGTEPFTELLTVPLDLPEGSVVQFDVSSSCTSTSPPDFLVFVETLSSGIDSASSIIPNNCGTSSSSCTTLNRFGISKALQSQSLTNGWQRVMLAIPSVSRGQRLRLYSSPGFSSTLAVTNVYIGKPCGKYNCGLFGRCIDGSCVCDAGYMYSDVSELCVRSPRLSWFLERFDDDIVSIRWNRILGATMTTSCGTVGPGLGALFSGTSASTRLLETQQLNLVGQDLVLFTMQMGGASCNAPSSSSEGVQVAYSTDGGVTYNVMLTIPYYTARSPTDYAIELPSAAQTEATQLMWVQGYFSGTNYDVWKVDNVAIGAAAFKRGIALDFSTSNPDSSSFVIFPDGELNTVCGKRAMTLSRDSSNSLVTIPLNITSGNVVQMLVTSSCGTSSGSEYLEVQELRGTNWATPSASTSPLSTTVFRVDMFQLRSADLDKGYHRISVRAGSSSSNTLRLMVANPSISIAQIAVGARCPNNCGDNGFCKLTGSCVCDPGYVTHTSFGCVPATPGSELREDFNDELLSTRWHSVAGGSLTTSSSCTSLVDGARLEFRDTGMRFVQTVELNTTNALYASFVISLGDSGSTSCRPPSSSSESVVFAYSTDFGNIWTKLATQYYYSTSRTEVSVALPSNARTSYTRFMWYQPSNSGANYDVWAIDNVYIGPSAHPGVVFEDFTSSTMPSTLVNIVDGEIGTYCGVSSTLAFPSSSSFQHEVTTTVLDLLGDFVSIMDDNLAEIPSIFWTDVKGFTFSQACGLSTKGWVFDSDGAARYATTVGLDVSETNLVLEFEFRFGTGGCDPPETTRDENVHLECSVDSGDTWNTVQVLTTSSTSKPQVPLDNYPICRSNSTQFRWKQKEFTTIAPASDVWAIANVKIGGTPLVDYYLQAEVLAGCGGTSGQQVDFEYRTNLASDLALIQTYTDPYSASTLVLPSVSYDMSPTKFVRRTWFLGTNIGNTVQVRVSQAASSSFALGSLFVGPACPSMCSGHGRCTASGFCRCDSGYSGEACDITSKGNPQYFSTNFATIGPEWWLVSGRAATISGCGTGLALDSDYRMAATVDLDLRHATSIVTSVAFCSYSKLMGLFYSVDAGVSWQRISQLSSASSFDVAIPLGARTAATRLMWASGTSSSRNVVILSISVGGACLGKTCGGNEVCVDGPSGATCECQDGFELVEGSCVQDKCAGVVCDSKDECMSSACDDTTGQCVSSPLDGTLCNDGDNTTVSDVCVSGTCRGTPRCENVDCSVFGQCFLKGTCVPTTGKCTPQFKLKGSSCDDGSDSTYADACDGAGNCVGKPDKCIGKPSCPSMSCMVGTCEASTGNCTYKAAPNGQLCDDGDATTLNDTCTAGTCMGIDLCDGVNCSSASCVSSACDYMTGKCVDTVSDDGTLCDDLNELTTGDQCLDGTCTGQPVCEVIICMNKTCHAEPTCSDGNCNYRALDDGTPCDDGDPSTGQDSCELGVCVGKDLCSNVTCPTSTGCTEYKPCDFNTGLCPAIKSLDGTLCVGGVCNNGVCEEEPPTCEVTGCNGTASQCQEHACVLSECILRNKTDGLTCDDGNSSTFGDTCQGGVCFGINKCQGVECNAAQCTTSTCNPLLGVCVATPVQDGIKCNDGIESTINDMCKSGVCSGQPDPCFGIVCQESECLQAGTCVEGKCIHAAKPNGTQCDDGDFLTVNDQCTGGECLGADPCATILCEKLPCFSTVVCFQGQCLNGGLLNDGTSCDDANNGTIDDVCVSGACIGRVPPPCYQKQDGEACEENGICEQGVCQQVTPATTTITTSTATATTSLSSTTLTQTATVMTSSGSTTSTQTATVSVSGPATTTDTETRTGSITSTTTTAATTTTTTTAATTTSVAVTTATAMSTTATPTTADPNEQPSSSVQEYIPAIIGASAAVLIVLILVVAFILWKRSASNTNFVLPPSSATHFENPTYDSVVPEADADTAYYLSPTPVDPTYSDAFMEDDVEA
eukprot:m.60739 g.60739  ORF g.60739 m.60739 type:complete len:3550 (+) comp11834_c0_seq1:480-11129(+)